MDNDANDIRSLVKEKKEIATKLALAGGDDFHFLLQDCSDLADMIEEIEDVSGQMGEKEHAAFEAKIKFSRKVRRKAKDLRNFEQHLVSEYENKHITLAHGKRMVSVIKLLRSKNVAKARREAEEFYDFLEMGSRLEIVDDLLLKKKASVEREKRGLEAKLLDCEWLEKEPSIDEEKVKRHEEREHINRQLSEKWQKRQQALKSMPLCALLLKMREDGLDNLGFPCLAASEADALSSFLQKSRLEAKTAHELHEMCGQSEQLLRHLGLDLPLFRQEIVARRAFLFSIMSYSSVARAPELEYLAKQDEAARALVERLSELGKTKEADEREWQRANRMKQKKEGLAGADKVALEKSLQELRALEDVLDGKTAPAEGTGKESEKEKGLFGSILKLLGKIN